MNPNQAGRRSFLCNAAILATGIAFGGVKNNLLSFPQTSFGLEKEWENFCKQNKAKLFSGILYEKRELMPCSGHSYKEGQLIYFPETQIIAQPIWIYWTSKPADPFDIVVNFYKNDSIVSINQFELSALNNLPKDKNAEDPLITIFKKNERGERILFARTIINNKRTTLYVKNEDTNTFNSCKIFENI